MAQRMARHPFLESDRRCRAFDGLVVNLSVQMVAAPDPGLRVHRNLPALSQSQGKNPGFLMFNLFYSNWLVA